MPWPLQSVFRRHHMFYCFFQTITNILYTIFNSQYHVVYIFVNMDNENDNKIRKTIINMWYIFVIVSKAIEQIALRSLESARNHFVLGWHCVPKRYIYIFGVCMNYEEFLCSEKHLFQ